MKVCVVGAGRMGLPVAVQFAWAGASVVSADIDDRLVAALNRGEAPFDDEPDLPSRLADVCAAGRYRATTDTAAAVADSDAVLVLVRMVVHRDGQPDYANLDAATASIAAGLRPGTVVSYETTLPVGDTRHRFGTALAAGSGMQPGLDFHLCFSPERVSSGRVFRDLATYPKIVGGLTDACAEAGRGLYAAHLPAEVWTVGSLEAAEFTKVAETTYRDVNIALANEFARYADQLGVDFAEVARAANSQPYSHLHAPGLGVGGHCIPVYPHFFIDRAADSRLVRLARGLNEEMPGYGAERLSALLGGGLQGRRVLVLGLSFRADLRESSHSTTGPVVEELRRHDADVRVHDPLFGRHGVTAHGYEWDDPASGWAEALVVNTAHTAYRELAPQDAPGVVAVLDGRNALDPAPWRTAGVAYAGIGR
jgi:nucleotide sugar dehydrogenase